MEKEATRIKEGLAKHYDLDAAAYQKRHYVDESIYDALQYRQAYIEALLADTELPANARILDVGCGPGELACSLTRRGFNVWGIDISNQMVEHARERLVNEGLSTADRLTVGDIEKLDFGDTFFDVVIASGVIEYQKTDEPALTEIHRVLKPGGHMIINVTNKFGYIKWIEDAYRWFKRRPLGWNLLNFVKKTILRKGPLNALPERRTHRPPRFDTEIKRHGFHKLAHNYFHFAPLPVPLGGAIPSISDPLGKRMESLSRSPIARWLAGGYLVQARKDE